MELFGVIRKENEASETLVFFLLIQDKKHRAKWMGNGEAGKCPVEVGFISRDAVLFSFLGTHGGSVKR